VNRYASLDPDGPLGPEFRLIGRLAAELGAGEAPLPTDVAARLREGLGDDAALWDIGGGLTGILTVDTMVAGVHAFDHEPGEAVGARALTAAASDVCAMGGIPRLALVALQLPRETGEEKLEALYRGLREEADALQLAVVGGDVVDTPGPLSISITVYGEVAETGIWRRSGARPGDLVLVSGSLGGSRAGVELLARGPDAPRRGWAAELVERHLRPRARVDTVRALAGAGEVHAAIDISDGLSSEAWHLALDSGVSLVLEASHIPLHPALRSFMEWLDPTGDEAGAVLYALDSGEEFELLLTCGPDHPALAGNDSQSGVPLTVIGRVEGGEPTVVLEGAGATRTISAGGWSHRGG